MISLSLYFFLHRFPWSTLPKQYSISFLGFLVLNLYSLVSYKVFTSFAKTWKYETPFYSALKFLYTFKIFHFLLLNAVLFMSALLNIAFFINTQYFQCFNWNRITLLVPSVSSLQILLFFLYSFHVPLKLITPFSLILYVDPYAHIRICIYTYMYIHMHTYIYTNINIHTYINLLWVFFMCVFNITLLLFLWIFIVIKHSMISWHM